MKKSNHFAWTHKAQEALDSLKNLLKIPPILMAPAPEEPMLLYIAATTQVASAALVVEREDPGRSLKVQRPVYFVSEVLSDSKTHYLQMQKLVYAILITKYPIMVVSKYPLEEVIQNPEAKVIRAQVDGGKTFHTRRIVPSSHRRWQTSSLNGRRSKIRWRPSSTRHGQCTSMARS
jgi:hypothetical protein